MVSAATRRTTPGPIRSRALAALTATLGRAGQLLNECIGHRGRNGPCLAQGRSRRSLDLRVGTPKRSDECGNCFPGDGSHASQRLCRAARHTVALGQRRRETGDDLRPARPDLAQSAGRRRSQGRILILGLKQLLQDWKRLAGHCAV